MHASRFRALRIASAKSPLASGTLTPALSSRQPTRIFSISLARSVSDEDYAIARQWLKDVSDDTIPRGIGDLSYSRSSGPGGQNVNKVNSKVQLRIPLDRLLPIVPLALHSEIRRSRYYAEKTNSLVLQADDSRKQATNRDTCYRRLHQMLLEMGKQVIPGETSEEQKEKVKTLKEYENESRLKSKKQHSGKKAARSKSFED